MTHTLGRGRAGVARFRRGLLIAVVILLAGASSAEAAPGKAEAKRHYRKGVTEYNLGHFQNAIAEFDKAYSLDPSPILLYDIAQSHRKLGNDREALFFFRRYLDEDPGTKDRPQVEQSIRELESVTRTPAVAPSPATSPPPVPTPPSVAPPPPVETVIDHGNQPAEPHRIAWKKPAAWVTAGLAVGALALGLQQNLAYGKDRRDFERMDACGQAVPGQGSDRCNSLYDDGQSAKRLSLAGYIGGGILAAVSAGLFYNLAQTDAPPRTAARSSCRLLGAAGSCTFVF